MQTRRKIRTAGRQLCWLPLECIRPNASQPRVEFDEFALMELAASIKENGLLQPVTVRPCGEEYELIMGERRCRACRMLGHTHIEAFILPADDAESALLALVENMQRRDLHFFEEAQAYQKLCEQGVIGKNDTVVSVVTGNGLKDVANAIAACGEPISIPNDMDLLLQAFAEKGIVVE